MSGQQGPGLSVDELIGAYPFLSGLKDKAAIEQAMRAALEEMAAAQEEALRLAIAAIERHAAHG